MLECACLIRHAPDTRSRRNVPRPISTILPLFEVHRYVASAHALGGMTSPARSEMMIRPPSATPANLGVDVRSVPSATIVANGVYSESATSPVASS